MSNIKLTDNEIKKTLQEMADYPHNYEEGQDLQNALAYINRLEAENEGLKAKCENTQVGYNFLKADFEETEKRNRDLVRAFQSYKAEAYKEFAERLKENISGDCRIVSDEGEYVGYDCDDVRYCINNLVKEFEKKENTTYDD